MSDNPVPGSGARGRGAPAGDGVRRAARGSGSAARRRRPRAARGGAGAPRGRSRGGTGSAACRPRPPWRGCARTRTPCGTPGTTPGARDTYCKLSGPAGTATSGAPSTPGTPGTPADAAGSAHTYSYLIPSIMNPRGFLIILKDYKIVTRLKLII